LRWQCEIFEEWESNGQGEGGDFFGSHKKKKKRIESYL
jgi:hypothetical protein